MPIYIGDYLKDTMHLTIEQHGSYFLILLDMWNHNGKIPDEMGYLSRVTRTTPEHFEKNIYHQIWGYFYQTEHGLLGHSRIDSELKKSKDRRLIAQQNGKKGGRPKTQPQTQKEPTGKPIANPTLNPEKSSSPSPSPSYKKKKREFKPPTLLDVSQYVQEKSYSVNAQNFFDYYNVTDWHDKDGKKVNNWKQKLISWNSREKKEPRTFAEKDGDNLTDLINNINEVHNAGNRKENKFLQG